MLVWQIRNDQSVKGITAKDEQIKLTLFADDMTCFARDVRSYRQLCVILYLFSKYSRLQVNNDKTETFAVGPHRLPEASFSHNICTSIKILGLFSISIYHLEKRQISILFLSPYKKC